MEDWTSFGKAIISLLIAILLPVSTYTNLLTQYDELVTISTTIVSCETKKRSSRSGTRTTIYFEISELPKRLYYTYPAKLREALLASCGRRDRVHLTYRRQYSRLSGSESYKLMGMESLTDGQIILTPADIEADRAWDRCFLPPVVILFLVGFFFYLMEATVPKPNKSRDTSIQEIPSGNPLKDKPFEINKQELIESLRTNPSDARGWLILGWMMAEDKKPERARECYERALKINLLSAITAGKLRRDT